jgi:CheY-like chemotaxis protein
MGQDAPRDIAPSITSVESETAEVTASVVDAGQLPSGAGPTILVVDHEPVSRATVARALTLAQFEVATASSGRDAVRLVAEGRVQPAVLVTDLEVPDMNGVELAARVLALRPAIRVVMVTGDTERAAGARRHPSIVDAVLLRPIDLDQLVDAVSSAVAQARSR